MKFTDIKFVKKLVINQFEDRSLNLIKIKCKNKYIIIVLFQKYVLVMRMELKGGIDSGKS